MGLSTATLEDLCGGETAQESAEMLKSVLGGSLGPKRDMVLLNSGAALTVAGLTQDIQGGVKMAAQIIDSGKATQKLEQLISLSRKLQSQA
jgi:anthranilate phosphoribosyltransferase